MLRKELDQITNKVIDYSIGEISPSLVVEIGQEIVKMHELLTDYWLVMEIEQEAV